MSVIVKTVIIFLLVVIVTHLIIRKSLNNPSSAPPPPPDVVDYMQNEVEEKKEAAPILDIPVVHSSTNIQPPQIKASTTDDLFNYVYKDNKEKKESMSIVAEVKSTLGDVVDDKTKIEGLCAFEDEGTSLYGIY